MLLVLSVLSTLVISAIIAIAYDTYQDTDYYGAFIIGLILGSIFAVSLSLQIFVQFLYNQRGM